MSRSLDEIISLFYNGPTFVVSMVREYDNDDQETILMMSRDYQVAISTAKFLNLGLMFENLRIDLDVYDDGKLINKIDFKDI